MTTPPTTPQGAADPIPEQAPPERRQDARSGRRWASTIVVPVAAVVLALIAGSVVIIVSSAIATGGTIDLVLPLRAYWSLAQGAFGNETAIVSTLVTAAPLVLGGLAVGIGFKAGLFNIGGYGQFLLGALAAAAVGAAVADWPAPIAIPVAIAAAFIVGGLYGFIPGVLKALTGAHEVVTTIMLNYIASSIMAYLITGPLAAPGFAFARTGPIGNAALPILFGRNLHLGVLIAFLVVPVIWWLLYRSTLGFEIRTVGANPSAGRYAGMRPAFLIVLTLSVSGALAGLAGGLEILGISGFIATGYGSSIGFDAISVALLGRAHPIGIMLAALLFGALRAGAGLMQIQAKIPAEIVDVIQAMILLFLAADVIVRRLLRVRATTAGVDELKTVTRSYSEGRVA